MKLLSILIFVFAALPSHADCIDEDALLRFAWPDETAPLNTEIVVINAPDLSQDGFELLDENNNALDFNIEFVGRGYRRLTIETPLMPLSLHTLNHRSGDGTNVRITDFLTEADDDTIPPPALEVTPPAYRDISPSQVFGTEGCPPPRPHEYTFSVAGGFDDVVVVELRAEDGTYVAFYSVDRANEGTLFFSLNSPIDGTFYLESVDAAGNRSRSNNVVVSSAQNCSHVGVSHKGVPTGTFALLVLIFASRRRKGRSTF